MAIAATMHRIAEKAMPIERLVVDSKLAMEMFTDNRYKAAQIPSIAEKSKTGKILGKGSRFAFDCRNTDFNSPPDSVTLYRVGDHVDISGGPMVGNSSFLGRRCTVAAAHRIEHDGVPMYRFQGVALPKGIFLNHHAFGILEKRASKLVR